MIMPRGIDSRSEEERGVGSITLIVAAFVVWPVPRHVFYLLTFWLCASAYIYLRLSLYHITLPVVFSLDLGQITLTARERWIQQAPPWETPTW